MLDQLPDDALACLLGTSTLTRGDLARVGGTCKRLRDAAWSPSLPQWRAVLVVGSEASFSPLSKMKLFQVRLPRALTDKTCNSRRHFMPNDAFKPRLDLLCERVVTIMIE